jgi:hypothetical protein
MSIDNVTIFKLVLSQGAWLGAPFIIVGQTLLGGWWLQAVGGGAGVGGEGVGGGGGVKSPHERFRFRVCENLEKYAQKNYQ